MNDYKLPKEISNIFEKEISKQKHFYLNYLLPLKNERENILSELNPLLTAYQKYQGQVGIIKNDTFFKLQIEIKEFLEKYWGEVLLKRFNQEVQFDKSKITPIREDGFWNILASSFAATFELHAKKTKAEINYRLNFLNFIRDCLQNEGLHPFIHQRDDRIYKRFNLLITFKENKKDYFISRVLLSQSELESDYLTPFYKGKQIFVHGKIIKASSISKINITSSLLLDDEIKLFGYKKGFVWTNEKKDENLFSKCCFDETNVYLKNPNAETSKKTYKNNSITYIAQSRIDEIESLKTKQFDLSKLISLCNELNQCSTSNSVNAVASLQRTIINHVPPIFGFNDFGQVVAQYKTGKSVKKNFERMYNSMKNISDNHTHSLISKADSLPNMTQVDFSNDLDVLLAEICKILKAKQS